jgi:flagellar FliJ protein
MQAILDVRKALEEKNILELSERRRELQKETENLERIQHLKSELIDALRSIQGGKVPLSEIAMQTAHIKIRQQQEKVQQENVRDTKIKLDTKRDELLDATKKKKAMEIYKARHFERYTAAANCRERTMLDELVIAGHNRGKEE